MNEFDSDIEFDFFEDLETHEEASPQERKPGRPPGGPPPRRPAGGPGLTPTLRLVGLIVFAIVVIVLLVFWVQSCQGSGKKKSYSNYMEQATVITRDSDAIGAKLGKALVTPGIKPNALAATIDGLATQQQQGLTEAEQLKAPGPLREENQSFQDTLGFRVNGLRGLADTFRRTAGSNKVATSSTLLASQAQRLITSDVVYRDLFRVPSVTELRAQGITGVPVPSSQFVVDAPNFGSPDYWTPVVNRLQGAATGGTTTPTTGFHGTGLVKTVALPSNKELSTTVENTVTAGTDLGFAVTVKDTGDSQEVGVKVTLTIQQVSPDVVATKTIDSINPGEEKTVTFNNLGKVDFVKPITIKVDIAPVPGEANRDNNSAEYRAILSLG
jgi:hypothetical protein